MVTIPSLLDKSQLHRLAMFGWSAFMNRLPAKASRIKSLMYGIWMQLCWGLIHGVKDRIQTCWPTMMGNAVHGCLENTLLRTFPRSQCRSRPCCNLGAVADCPCLADQHQSCQIESCDWARLFVTSFSFFLAIDVLSEDWRESSGTSFSLFIACCNVSFNLRSQCGSGISWMLLKDTVTKWL